MKTATIRVGSREITVEQAPLHVNYFSCGVHEFILSQPKDGQLRLLPSRGVRVLGSIFCVLGWPVLILGLLAMIGLLIQLRFENLLGTLFLLGWGFPFAFFGVKLLGRRWLFDSRAGELTLRYLWRIRRWPLANIVAVQVINAGLFGSDKERFISFQMNLILDDPSEPRLFVALNKDVADMGKKAKQVADFLHVPLLEATEIAEKSQEDEDSRQDSGPPMSGRSDPTRFWARTNEPLPPFDLEAGTLGGLTWGVDGLEQAEFLGRPDRVEHCQHPGEMRLHFLERGFEIAFLPHFIELICSIAPASDVPPAHGQGYSRPRLSGGIELTPQTSDARVRDLFGPPKSEHDYPENKTRILVYHLGRFYMEFEFEKSTGRLLSWTVPL